MKKTSLSDRDTINAPNKRQKPLTYGDIITFIIVSVISFGFICLLIVGIYEGSKRIYDYVSEPEYIIQIQIRR